MPDFSSLRPILEAAVQSKKIRAKSLANIVELLSASSNPLYIGSIAELAERGEWTELDDRFFKKLTFGTSGLRGRTIGKIVTAAERGNAGKGERPQFPCVGTNAMNHFNMNRALRGLVNFLKSWLRENGQLRKPTLVLCHDTRLFSREFAEFCAKLATENGADAYLFESHRATPELSYAVRQLNADAGAMITASHNPAHDNGFKVYFNDGASIVDPVATSIIDEVNSISSDQYEPLPASQQGKITLIGKEMDEQYLERMKDLLLDPSVLERGRDLKIVYTALHGAGGVLVPVILRRLGFTVQTVPEQDVPDGWFPTVASPNPENAAALQMGIDLANKIGADIVIGTDPDCDRMGVVVRDGAGKMQLITGNQIGSLMAWHRVKTFFETGVLNEGNKKHAALIKTFVTTDLQKAICEKYGIRCVETLTGFKWIGQKLSKYERLLPESVQKNYRQLSETQSREERLKHGVFFVFGGEESYGYQGADFVRDKDGNGAVVMFAELAAYTKSLGVTIVDLLDRVYCEFGYFLEKPFDFAFPGADGDEQREKLVESYQTNPPTEINGSRVVKIENFARDEIRDCEGDVVPKERMFIHHLEDGRVFAVRPSGTEPKIKYYCFGRHLPAAGGQIPAAELAGVKAKVLEGISQMWADIERDIRVRLGN